MLKLRYSVVKLPLAVIEIAQAVVAFPIIWAECDGLFICGLGVCRAACAFVSVGHSRKGVRVPWVQLQGALEFRERQIILARVVVDTAERYVGGWQAAI